MICNVTASVARVAGLAAVLCSVVLFTPEVAADTTCEGVPVEVDGLVIVPAGISGHPARLVLDPIGNVLLDATYVQEAGIATVDSEAAGFGPDARVGGAGGGEQVARFAVGQRLDIGNLGLDLPPVIVVDLRGPLGLSFRDIDGLLGTDLFAARVLDLDLEGRCLVLHDRSGYTAPAGFEALDVVRQRRRPTIRGEITLPGGERIPLTLLLDFGMAGTVRLSTRFVDEHRLTERLETTVPERMETGLGGELRSLRATLGSVVLGDMVRADIPVSLARESEGADADPPWDALIGVGFLKAGRVIYDPGGDRVWLDIQ